MSRVYTERSIRLAVGTTAIYCSSFLKALPGARISFPGTTGPGTSLLELFLNLFDTSDPYLAKEVEIFHDWVFSSKDFPLRDSSVADSRLHAFTKKFEADWPSPAAWARGKLEYAPEFFEPLPQNSPRIYLRNYHRKRL